MNTFLCIKLCKFIVNYCSKYVKKKNNFHEVSADLEFLRMRKENFQYTRTRKNAAERPECSENFPTHPQRVEEKDNLSNTD